MNSLNDSLDKFYKKIPGSYWGIIGGIFGLTVFLIASILHSLTEPISFFTHWVSHLGWGPNGSEHIFRIGIIMLGCFVTPYMIFLTRFLWSDKGEEHAKIKNLIIICGIITALFAITGLFMVSIFGNIAQPEFILHLMGAMIYFVMSGFFMIFYTLSMIISKKWNKIQIIITIINLAFFFGLIITAIPVFSEIANPTFISTFQSWTGAERVAYLTSIIPQTAWLTFFEWTFVISTCSWFIIWGISTLKLEREL